MGNRVNNFKTLMKNPQQRNIYITLVAVGVVSLGAGLWFSNRPVASKVDTSISVADIPKLNAVPGSSDSQRYNEMVQQNNENKFEEAKSEGKSFVPTIVNNQINALSPLDMLALEEQKKREKLELEEQEKAKQEEMAKLAAESFNPPPLPPAPEPLLPAPPPVDVIQTQQSVQQQYVDPEADKKWKSDDYLLVAALQESWKNKAPAHEFDHYGKTNQNQNTVSPQFGSGGFVQANTQVSNSAQVAPVTVADQKAGDIIHAVLDTGINSSEPSPIMATVVSGQYKGAKLLGRFMRSGKKVVLQFNTMSIPGYPRSVAINTIAVDPETNRTSMATDVDNHYFLKYGVLLAATFLKGYSEAVSNQGSTTTITPLGGIVQTQDKLNSKEINQKAIGAVGTELAEQTKETINDLEPTIYVEAGSTMGILFMEDFYVNGTSGAR